VCVLGTSAEINFDAVKAAITLIFGIREPVDGVDTDIATVSVNIVRLVSALVPTFFIQKLRTV